MLQVQFHTQYSTDIVRRINATSYFSHNSLSDPCPFPSLHTSPPPTIQIVPSSCQGKNYLGDWIELSARLDRKVWTKMLGGEDYRVSLLVTLPEAWRLSVREDAYIPKELRRWGLRMVFLPAWT